MKFLVTGGCGFIGSHLVDALLAKNHQVEVIDNLSTGRTGNIARHLKNPGLKLWIEDTINPVIVEELVQKNDFVFHLAAAVGVKTVMKHPLTSLETNIEGTRNILKYASKYKKPVLFTSTSEIYGKNENVPFSEDTDIVLGPTSKKRWGYACSKALDEFLAFAYKEEAGLKIIITRLFNTVGPGQTEMYGMVLPRFISQAIEGKPLTIFGNGNQTRCFIHVRDVITAFTKLIETEKAYGKLYNVGSDEEITIKALAELVIKITGSSSRIIHVDPEKVYSGGFEDMKRRVPDTGRIRKLLNFKPEYTLENIVRDTFAYFKSSGTF